jgi:subfamily B ATP-binding cassette protein MsbA
MQYEYYTKHDSGHIVNQLVNQIPGFVGSFVAFKNFFTLLITVIIYYSFAMIANINFAIFATLIGILIMIIFKKFSYKHKQLSRKTVRELSLANKHIVQSIQAYKYLSATNQMNYLKLELVRCLKNVAFNQRNQVKMTALTNASKEPISVIFMMMIIVIQMSFFEVNIPSIIVVLLLMNRALGSIFDMQSAWQSTMTNIGSLESIEHNFHELSENQEVSGSIVLPSFCRNIVMKDLYFAYDKGDGYALKNINLTLNANETVAFVGHSGSGKSTLSDVIVALLRPSKGDLFIDGISIKEIDVESWRDKIGYISQDVVIFDDTISNNIGMWNGDNLSSDEYILRVNDAAKKAGILEFVNTLKDGFDTKVGDRGVRLSGGQKQRLFIARELYRRPKILILDEATSALDSKSEKIIESSINKLSGEMTIIMIAHRLSTIKNADRIVVLDEGVVVQSGSYEELVSLPGMFKEMVELQFS